MVSYPEMRAELILTIRSLADASYQEKVWISRQLPKEIWEDNFDMAVHFIFDDMALETDLDKAVGDILENETEAVAIQQVVSALNQVLDDVGTESPDDHYLHSRYWPQVIMAARQAYITLTGQPPEGLFDAIQAGRY